jgi:hypothetical protein
MGVDAVPYVIVRKIRTNRTKNCWRQQNPMRNQEHAFERATENGDDLVVLLCKPSIAAEM